MATADVRFWASLDTNFSVCILEAETSVSNLTQYNVMYKLFIGDDNKNTPFEVTSFKKYNSDTIEGKLWLQKMAFHFTNFMKMSIHSN